MWCCLTGTSLLCVLLRYLTCHETHRAHEDALRCLLPPSPLLSLSVLRSASDSTWVNSVLHLWALVTFVIQHERTVFIYFHPVTYLGLWVFFSTETISEHLWAVLLCQNTVSKQTPEGPHSHRQCEQAPIASEWAPFSKRMVFFSVAQII